MDKKNFDKIITTLKGKKDKDAVKKSLAFDQAVGKLQEAGLAKDFIRIIEKDPDFIKAISKMSPNLSDLVSAGWSCCITVSDPVGIGEDVINPADTKIKGKIR